ncbi:hypothetical protein ES703_49023 [subsurface metagenome]
MGWSPPVIIDRIRPLSAVLGDAEQVAQCGDHYQLIVVAPCDEERNSPLVVCLRSTVIVKGVGYPPCGGGLLADDEDPFLQVTLFIARSNQKGLGRLVRLTFYG